MVKNVPSENIKKLRELQTTLCHTTPNCYYSGMMEKLDIIIDDGKESIESEECDVDKITCYESMFTSIISLLNKYKYK